MGLAMFGVLVVCALIQAVRTTFDHREMPMLLLFLWGAVGSVVVVVVIDIVPALRLLRFVDVDPLTGLGNRAAFQRYLSESCRYVSREIEAGHQVVVAVGFYDLDDFKEVNDTHGHAGGDAVLVRISETLQRVLRAGDHCCRLGGDEFAVIIRADSREQARCAVQRIAFVLEDVYGRTISFGVAGTWDLARAQCSPSEHDLRRLVNLADVRMYEHKREDQDAGRNDPQGAATASVESEE